MLLEHRFTIPVPPDDAWAVLLDVERVASCMPGATLASVDDDGFTGKVKVKVGPITVTYQGQGRFRERDDSAHRAVIEAFGREMRGPGTASATFTATLEPRDPDQTEVLVATDVMITGRLAQFGRTVIAEVGAKLLATFAECVAGKIISGAAAEELDATRVTPTGPYEAADHAPLDVLEVAGGSVARRVLPPVAGLAALAIGISWWWRRRNR